MDLLKLALTILPVFISLDYIEDIDEIIFAIDTSLNMCGRVLIQLVKGRKQ